MKYEHTTNGFGIAIKCVCTGNSSVGELGITNVRMRMAGVDSTQLNFCIISSYVQQHSQHDDTMNA